MNLSRFFQFSLVLVAFTIPQTEPAREKRMAGNTKLAKPGQFPYAVFLYWFWYLSDTVPRSQITRVKCSANLVSPHFVLTAAHCYQHLLYTYRNYSTSYDFVANLTRKHAYTYTRAGTVDGFGMEPGWQERRGDMLFIPGAYARPSTMFDLDIAIVRIPVAYIVDAPRVTKVALARVSEVPGFEDYRDCLTAGYGYVDAVEMQVRVNYKHNAKQPQVNNKLRFYKVKFALNNFCKYLQYQLDGRYLFFDDFYGCARSIGSVMNSTYATSCFGDAGGSLVCSGLLTAILVQRREREPCDYYASDTSFTMYTLLGAADVQAWLRTHLDMAPLVPLPPWDPWDVTAPPKKGKNFRVSFEAVEGDETDKTRESVQQRQKDMLGGIGRKLENEESGAKKNEERSEKSAESERVQESDKLDYSELGVNGSTKKINLVKGTETMGSEIMNKADKLSGVNIEGTHLGFKMAGDAVEVDDFEMNPKGTEPPGSSTRSVVETRLAPTDTAEAEREWSQAEAKVITESRRRRKSVRDVNDLKAGTNPTQERIRRNVNGEVVEGDIRDDDPDLLRLLTLIRGGGVELDPVRRKRQEARWQLREAMAKDLLRATRDLDPEALDRFGMGADVLTRDEVGEDAWAREVWEDAFEKDRDK